MSQGLVVPAPVAWRVLPLRPPHLLRACPRCGGQRPFACSERFRVNASGRRLDVWLVYRCAACDFTWNLTVLERVAPEAVGAARLEAFHRNDLAAAWACAFDAGLWRRAGARPEPATPVRVERPPLEGGALWLRLSLPWPVAARLDRLLAAELRLPRARLPGLVDEPRALRRPVRDGQLVRLAAVEAPGAGG